MKRFQKKKRNLTSQNMESLILKQDTPFAIQEAYKALRTNVAFSLPGLQSRCIGITSSAAGEGKSTNVINLAASFGEIGKKVLLIDCDLRMPTIALKTGIKGQPGLSDCLIGESSIEDSIQHIDTLKIDVLPSGNIPPDSTILLESKGMAELIQLLRLKYDYIFFDFPPVTTVTDAVILSEQLDGYLLVVKQNYSEYRTISSMLHQLRFVGAKVLGVIYTNVQMDWKQRYHQSYGKYYGR